MVQSSSAPPEVKQLYQILDKDQSNLNHSSSKPLQETGEVYQKFVEYLREEKPSVDWLHHNESSSTSDTYNSAVVSPWWIYHKTVH